MRRLAATLALAAIAFALASGGASAASRRTVIPPPTSGTLCRHTERLPHWGGGAYLTAVPCGFYIGRAFVGDRFDSQRSGHSGFSFGIDRRLGLCAWIDPDTLGRRRATVRDGCSDRLRRAIADQYTFGRNFNCPRHGCHGPSAPVRVNRGCPRTLFYNYVRGHFRDRAPGLTGARVRYRYTTRDRRAVVVLADRLGWGFLPARCVTFRGF